MKAWSLDPYLVKTKERIYPFLSVLFQYFWRVMFFCSLKCYSYKIKHDKDYRCEKDMTLKNTFPFHLSERIRTQ